MELREQIKLGRTLKQGLPAIQRTKILVPTGDQMKAVKTVMAMMMA